MTAIECFNTICDRQGILLVEVSTSVIRNNLSDAVNRYLYLLTNKLEIVYISTLHLEDIIQYAPALKSISINRHCLLIPLRLYDKNLIIEIDVTNSFLSIYEKNCIFCDSLYFNSLKNFIIFFLSNDKFIDRILFTLDYIYTNATILDNILINKGFDLLPKNVSKCEADFKQELDNLIKFRDELLIKEQRTYTVYLFKNLLHNDIEQYYLHFYPDKIKVDSSVTLFHFSLDKYRSLLILKDKNLKFYLFKSNQVLYSNFVESNSLFSILYLINKKDIYDFLDKVNMFIDDSWKEYINSLKG